jgi:hypothetical protein
MMADVDRGQVEVPLTGGRVARGVVRVAETVRRPLPADPDYVHGLLLHLERCGFEGAPRFLGIDSRGREILSYIEGSTLARTTAFASAGRRRRRAHGWCAGCTT